MLTDETPLLETTEMPASPGCAVTATAAADVVRAPADVGSSSYVNALASFFGAFDRSSDCAPRPRHR